MSVFKILFLPFLLSLTACSSKSPISNFKWSANHPNQFDKQQLQKALETEKDGQVDASIQLGDLQLTRWNQKIGSYPIRNSWVQVLRKENNVQYAKGQILENPGPQIETEIKIFENQKNKIIKTLKKKNIEFAKTNKIFSTEIVLVQNLKSYKPFLAIRFLKSDDSDVLEYLVDTKGNVVEKKSVAMHLIDGLGTVYSGVSQENELIDVIFKQMLGDGTLTSEKIKVLSDFESIKNPTHVFRFQPDENSFNSVQSYYHVNKMLNWFDSEFQLKLPFQLNVKVHVGGARPKNVMFYYDGNIRLGDGDGLVYRNIPRDATIVSHEVAHAFVDTLSGLPTDGEGASLNEGFSDFIAANLLNTPKMGELAYLRGDYKRTLENSLKAYEDFNGGKYHDSLVVSSTFWNIRKSLGQKMTALLAIRTLIHLGPNGKFADFVSSVEEALTDNYSEAAGEKVREALNQKGWYQN